MDNIAWYCYVGVNGLSFLLFAFDKYKAIHHSLRIREKHLLLSAVLGPLGSLLGMLVCRHKIRKLKFILWVPIFIGLHIFIYFALVA
ncbi:MAG: DUF1294 domain-containing protein [Vallitaleaceae bacterium]|nr:DUF1294 domain-containing protein [Vallitaleaceae bacterium]